MQLNANLDEKNSFIFILFTTYCESFSQIVYYQGGALGGVLYAASGSLMPEHGFYLVRSFQFMKQLKNTILIIRKLRFYYLIVELLQI